MKINKSEIKRILISRTDSIGDVMLTLPMCVWLKQHFPEAKLIYLGKSYTKPVVDCFSVIEEFADWDSISKLPTVEKSSVFQQFQADVIIHVFPNKEIASLAKKVKIPVRIGTSHRGFHLISCNFRVNFTRKNSELHESQLNFELLRPLGLTEIPSLSQSSEMTRAFVVKPYDLPKEIEQQLQTASKTVILHTKSQGSAVEWPLASYNQLAKQLVKRGYTVFFTGTEKEGVLIRPHIDWQEHIIDTSGKLSLNQLIVFISRVRNLVACSTGPLHIAGFCGVRTIGLFSPRKPIHPGRWQPLGSNVVTLVYDPECPVCKAKKSCLCIQDISVERVLEEIQ